jgi:hypothetical protein
MATAALPWLSACRGGDDGQVVRAAEPRPEVVGGEDGLQGGGDAGGRGEGRGVEEVGHEGERLTRRRLARRRPRRHCCHRSASRRYWNNFQPEQNVLKLMLERSRGSGIMRAMLL